VAVLVVDAMNVIGSRPDGWWRDRPGAIRRLVADLTSVAADLGGRVVVAIDGRPLSDLEEGEHEGVEVLYARRRGPDAADDRIVELVASLAEPRTVRVVTSDRELARRVRELGADVVGASWLHDQLAP
jgi:predicted RNA-binding protein with PIN domain